MKKKILIGSIIAVVLLTLVSFSSVVGKVSLDDELVEIDVEFSGLGKKHTVKLTRQEADEVELLFDDMQVRLSEVETRGEAEAIFKDTLMKLDRYGLLGGLSVKQAYQLATGNSVRKHLLNRLDEKNNTIFEDENSNYLCFIAGYLSWITVQNIISRIQTRFYYRLVDFLDIIISWANNNGYDINEDVLSYILYYIYDRLIVVQLVFGLLMIYFPFSFLSTLSAGRHVDGPFNNHDYFPSDGNVVSFGLLGAKSWDGELWGVTSDILIHELFVDYYPAILGFTGIKFTTQESDTFFIGFALKVSMSHDRP